MTSVAIIMRNCHVSRHGALADTLGTVDLELYTYRLTSLRTNLHEEAQSVATNRYALMIGYDMTILGP